MTDRLPPSAWSSRKPDRRRFLAGCGVCGLGLLGLGAGLATAPPRRARAAGISLTRGLAEPHLSPWFESMDGNLVQCTLCPRACVVPDGQRGQCEVRENRGGRYYSMVYGNPCAVNNDPIEKKPFFHVLPASLSFSIATAGCNFDCKFCQNWEISQTVPEATSNYALSPRQVVEQAIKYKAKSVASTYVEPTIFLEYMLDIGKQCRKQGLLNVMHSNGYVQREPLEALIPHLDAACVDLKGITEAYYGDMTTGRLAPVQDTLRTLVRWGVHTETVTLMIPGHNDDPAELRALAEWVRDYMGVDTPMHFTRFHPTYKLQNLSPTPVETLELAVAIARDVGMRYVYMGNVPGNDNQNTTCPHCDAVLIRRVQYESAVEQLRDGRCARCNEAIPGIWTKSTAL
jgi:pyruvate formate lyase activating enzyme